MRSRETKYILNGRVPEACGNLMRWSEWMHIADRRVARTTVGEIDVSTVFLGIDHRFSGNGPPVVFETMCFCGTKEAGELPFARYSTWDEAKAGHEAAVMVCQAGEKVSEVTAQDLMTRLMGAIGTPKNS